MLSEELRASMPEKPDSEAWESWYNHALTQYFLSSLKIIHLEQLEEMSEVETLTMDSDVREMYKHKFRAEMVDILLDMIESLRPDVGGDDV